MPVAQLWRMTSLDAWGGGPLELSALHLYGSAGRVDVPATLTCSHIPASGTLTALQDEDAETRCAFSAAQVRSPGFRLQWDFGPGNTADVWGLRVGAGGSKDLFLSTCSLQYHNGNAWVAAEAGAYNWPAAGSLTPAPTGPLPWGVEIAIWTERTAAGVRGWRAVSASADGQRVVAGVYGGYIYTSADGGATWTGRTAAGSRGWRAVSVSADGQRVVAGVYGGYIYTSTNGGVTWTGRTAAGSRNWLAVSASADGQRVVAGVDGGYIYTSADGGATWTGRTAAGSRNWEAVSMSADGQCAVAGVSGGYLYTSVDGGVSWTERTAAGARNWYAAAMSADGQRVVAGVNGGYIYTSTDEGANWAERTAAGSRGWQAAAMSADGQRVVAGVGGGYLYTSVDGGVSWTERTAAGSRNWQAAAMSADGQRVVAGVGGGYLYTSGLRSAQFAEPRLRTPMTSTLTVFTRPVGPLRTIAAQRQQVARDVEFGGSGIIWGTVKEKNTPANTPLRRRVVLIDERSRMAIRETWSDAATGIYEFRGVKEGVKYTVLTYDHSGAYRAVVADNLTLANGGVELMP